MVVNSSTSSQIKEAASLYRPNFCSECGAKILRLHWRLWSSRRFCDDCAKRLRKWRWTTPLLAAVVLLCIGMVAGRAGRPAPPPLIIERHANSPLFNDDDANNEPESADARSSGRGNSADSRGEASSSNADDSTDQRVAPDSESAGVEEMAYTCGARTKKGTPCSRRVYGPVRCWQHKGKPAMLPQEKLKMSDKL